MFPNNEIDDLNDDGFEGSTDESRIFAEVFLGIDLDRTSSWGFPSESINECKFFKQTDNSLFSNSNNSAIPSHVGSCYAIEDLRENSAHCCSSEGDHLFLRNDHDMNDKRMRLPVDELSYSGHHSVGLFHSPAPFKRVVSDISRAAAQGVCHSVTCHVVESSRQGVTSSCHLLKWLAEKNLGGEIGDWNVAKLQPQDMGNYTKEVDASKTICSPMSQDSSASKLLVASPFSSALNNSGSCQSAEKTIMLFKDHKMSTITAISRDSMNNPRQFLRNHVQDLLRAAGWGIGRRKRQNNIRGEFLYYSPWGDRPIRELRRVWHLCGRSFFPNAKTVRQGGNKQWADMTHLWSDLSNTIFKIEKELSNKETATVLAQQWYLLDPFVTMAFIDKKLDALRAGKSVKARRTLVIDTSEEDAVMALDYVDVTGKQLEEQSRDCDFSLVKKSALTVSDSIYDSCSEKCQSGSSAYIGKLPEQGVKDLEGLSVHLPEYERTQSTYSVHKTGTWCGEFSKNKRTRQSESFLQARGPDSTYDYFDSCLFEVPITFEDANAICGRFETVSPCYDHNKGLEGCNRHRSDNDDVIDLEVKDNKFLVSCEEGKTFNGQLVEIVENQLKESLNNHLSCRSGDIAQSNDQNGAHVAFYTHVENVSEPCKPSLLANSHLVDIDIKVMQHPAHIEQVDEQSMGVSECKSYCSSPFLDATFKRRAPKKLERTTNGKPTLCQNARIPIPYYDWEQRDIRMESIPIEHSGVGDSYRRGTKQSSFRKFATGKSKKSCHFPSEELNFENTTDEAPLVANDESLHLERWMQDDKTEKPHSQNERMQRSSMCHLKDKDLLISAIVKNKTFSSSGKRYGCKRKSFNSQARRKHKIQKGSCRLLPRSLSKGGNHIEGKLSVLNIRTILSWLIDLGVISLGEVAQYRSPKYDTVVKDGIVTRDGIFCKCCNKLLSVTEFKIHAGFRLNRPCLDLFMESGKSFALCQLEAWSAEYKARKSATRPVDVEGMDQNDDRCGLCGDGGELICCDNCPSTFHQECLEQQDLPEGSWYCAHCTCRICGELASDKAPLKSPAALMCSQCEHKYHKSCLKDKGCTVVGSDDCFCCQSCQQVYSGLHSRIGFVNLLSDGFSWTLVKCIHGDQRVHSTQKFVALKAECNAKLAVALTIMEECFLTMVDSLTGIDMIPHILYNWGSEYPRLNYNGFYTVVLEKDDVLISVASIRFHGVTVAEMPLIATCSKYRRQGMCRRLLHSIEEMLKSYKVEKLVISAIPSLVETWTVGFGFTPMEDNERKSLRNINLMVFPGTVWLKKHIYDSQATNLPAPGQPSSLIPENPTEREGCYQEGSTTETRKQSDGSSSGNEAGSYMEISQTDSKNMQIE